MSGRSRRIGVATSNLFQSGDSMRYFETTTKFLLACTLLGGCALDAGDDPSEDTIREPSADVAAPQLGGIVEAPGGELSNPTTYFSGNWNYSWGDTQNSTAVIGTPTGRKSFITGIPGDLRPGG